MKLRNPLIQSMYYYNLSGCSFSILIYSAQFQNEENVVCNFVVSEVAEAIGYSKNTIYKNLETLNELGFITINYTDKYKDTWEFKINNNVINKDYGGSGGYVNTDLTLLHTKEFHNLKRNEKYLVLRLLKLNNRFSTNKSELTISILKIFEEMKLSDISILYKYLITLKNLTYINEDNQEFKFFDMEVYPGKIIINKMTSRIFDKRSLLTERDVTVANQLFLEKRKCKELKKTENGYLDTITGEIYSGFYDYYLKNPDFKNTVRVFTMFQNTFGISFMMEKAREVLNSLGSIPYKYLSRILSLISKRAKHKNELVA